MAGSLIKIQEEVVSSAVSSVSIGGTNWVSSYDVYQLMIRGLTVSASNTVDIQFLVSNSAGSYSNNHATNGSDIPFGNTINSSSNHASNAIIYLYNFNNANGYSFMTYEETAYNGSLVGRQGGAVLSVAQATNGVLVKAGTGNITAGTFKLYGLKK